MKKIPSFNTEKELLIHNAMVFGIDEVGRGCFAGPLVAAAVSFKQEIDIDWFREINDSKLIKPQKRAELSKLILEHGVCFIEEISVAQIDKWGIGHCNKLVFEKLIKSVIDNHKSKIFFLIDGRQMFKNENTEFIVKGDTKSISIAAASIIAKVYRDNLMQKYHELYPNYNFKENKGYGTKFHRTAIKKYGLCDIHRKSFKLDKFL